MPVSINCQLCNERRAAKLCSSCTEHEKLCSECSAKEHASGKRGHKPRDLCIDCFERASQCVCESCSGKVCAVCLGAHVEVCEKLRAAEDSDDSSAANGNHSDAPSRAEYNSECESDSEDSTPAPCKAQRSAASKAAPSKPSLSKHATENAALQCSEGDVGRDQSDSDDEDEPFAPAMSSDEEGSDFEDEMAAGARSGSCSKPRSKGHSKGGPSRHGGTAPQAKCVPQKEKKEEKKKKALPKVAEVIEPEAARVRDGDKAAPDPKLLERVRKALALGMHTGGNEDEKRHAMQRATRLMQQHGICQADLEALGGKKDELGASVEVRLKGLYQRWPSWGKWLCTVATDMCTARSYFTIGNKARQREIIVTFYGLEADAYMAARVYEEAYNLVLEKGEIEYGKQGRSKLDYREGVVQGLLKVAAEDARRRKEKIALARKKLEAQEKLRIKHEAGLAAVKTENDAAGSNATAADGAAGAGVKVEKKEEGDDVEAPLKKVKEELDVVEDAGDCNDRPAPGAGKTGLDSASGRPADSDTAGPSQPGGQNGGDSGLDYGDGDNGDDDWEEKWTKDYAGESGVLMRPGQLVLYQDHAKTAFEQVEQKVKIKKGKKRKRREVRDWEAYKKGKRDGEQMLGSLTSYKATDEEAS